MADSTYDALRSEVSSRGAETALATLAEQLRREQRYHELFDTRLMQTRHQLGLPLLGGASIDELPEPLRSQTEEAYLEACQEVGALLAEAGQLREAWMYLRPTGNKELLAAALEKLEPNDDNLDDLVELALHEGIAPAHGFQIVLDHFGTCNAITTFDNLVSQLPLSAQIAATERLIARMHQDVLENVRAHIEQHQAGAAEGKSLAELVAAHPEIFENDSYHIDVSHLGSTVRFARLVTRREPLRMAWELTEYGRRLAKTFQYAGEPPFENLYPTHGLLFAATLGEQVDEAVEYFRQQAEEIDASGEGTAAIETYLILLTRLERFDHALEEMARLVPSEMQLSPYAPKMFELAQSSGSFTRYLAICQERGDVLGYTAGLIAASREVANAPAKG